MCPWLPTALYERLPLLYALAALLCLLAGSSVWLLMSAAALGSAAVMTWLWRRDYRRAPAPQPTRRRTAPKGRGR